MSSITLSLLSLVPQHYAILMPANPSLYKLMPHKLGAAIHQNDEAVAYASKALTSTEHI